MATDDTTRAGWAFRLLFLALVLVPVVAPLAGSGADVLQAVGLPAVDLPAVDAPTLIRAVVVGVVMLVVGLLVRQKRRTRGQQAEETAGERESGRQVEGSGEVYAPYAYNNQQQARRESRKITNRAEEIAEADREARKRR